MLKAAESVTTLLGADSGNGGSSIRVKARAEPLKDNNKIAIIVLKPHRNAFLFMIFAVVLTSEQENRKPPC